MLDLREAVAETLAAEKSYNVPGVCRRYGLDDGDETEAFQSKRKYILRRLQPLTDDRVLDIAKELAASYDNDNLHAAIEERDDSIPKISLITRQDIAEILDHFPFSERRPIIEAISECWPETHNIGSEHDVFGTLQDDIFQHMIKFNDWSNSNVLDRLPYYECSQKRLFGFLETLLHPKHRRQDQQKALVEALNPMLRRDGFKLAVTAYVSGYPAYQIVRLSEAEASPATDIISEALGAFDEDRVNASWQKALDRRTTDPDGAITAARSLLESVCKHILDEAGEEYGHEDLPHLYRRAAKLMNMRPEQHTEDAFRRILGSCHQIVDRLSEVRNIVGDAHGQGRRGYKPAPRHAEFAVNLAGSMALFLVSTWNNQKNKSG